MLIEVRDGNQVLLVDADDFTRLSVKLIGITGLEERRRALAQVGQAADHDHVLIDPEALTSLAGTRAEDPAWRASFEGMIGYARSKGWLDDAGRVQVHVEPD